MALLSSKASYILFKEVTSDYPTRAEIIKGVYAMHKMSGDLRAIPCSCYSQVPPSAYSHYAPADMFPSTSKYAEKYDDLVRAKDVLKNDRYGGDYETIGKAIGLIKRFLDTHGKA